MPPLAPTWRKAVAKGAKLRHLTVDLGFHVHHMASIWSPSVLLRAKLQPNMTHFRPLALQWSARQGSLGPSLGPTRANFADSMRHAENSHFHRDVQRFLGLMGFVQGHVAHIGLVLGPTSAPDAPTQDQISHAKHNLRPNVPNCAMLDRVRRKLRRPT